MPGIEEADSRLPRPFGQEIRCGFGHLAGADGTGLVAALALNVADTAALLSELALRSAGLVDIETEA